MTYEQLSLLLKEEGYPAHMIANTIVKLNNLADPIKKSFEYWCQSGIIPTDSIDGYDFLTLTQNFHMKPVGAFLTLDWLTKEPKEAKIALSKGIR